MSFLQFQIDHLDFLLLLPDLLLAILKNVLLNIRLLIENAQFVIAVNQLNTHVVATFSGLLVLVDQVVHFFLPRVDDQVELIGLVDLLVDDRLLLSELVLVLVEFSPSRVSLLGLLLDLVLDFEQSVVLLS